MNYGHIGLRLGIDLTSMGLMSALITARRPRRGLVMVYASFNVGLFVVLIAIASRSVGAGVGFGLFALLSIVRLRSEPISNPELSYFFCALVLGLVNGVGVDSMWLLAAMNAVVLACLFVVDHPRVHRRTARQIVTLDGIFTDALLLRVELEHRLGAEVIEFSVQETDYVREITRVVVRYGLPVGAPEAEGILTDVG